MSADKKILVVSADNRFQRALQRSMTDTNFDVKATCSRNEDLLRVMVDIVPDLTILDTPLASMQCVRELLGIRATTDTPLLMLSTQGAKADTVRTLSLGSCSHPFIKPITYEQLIYQISLLMNKN